MLACDLCVTKAQAFAARIAGADGVIVPACLPPNEVQAVMSGAASTHMLSVLDVQDETELHAAHELRPRAVLLPDTTLCASVRPGITIIVRVSDPESARALQDVADAALATADLVLTTSFQSLVSELDR